MCRYVARGQVVVIARDRVTWAPLSKDVARRARHVTAIHCGSEGFSLVDFDSARGRGGERFVAIEVVGPPASFDELDGVFVAKGDGPVNEVVPIG